MAVVNESIAACADIKGNNNKMKTTNKYCGGIMGVLKTNLMW
jgi:hypothetical protein